MAKNWEPIFINWTKPPSDAEESRCENAVEMIKKAIKADGILSKMTIEVFAQGSYANNTNVKLNSDVDVCVCNMDYFYTDYPEGMTNNDFGNQNSEYIFSAYKAQVGIALTNYFGSDHVKKGKKAFDIKSNSYRVDADAVPCFEHRRYTGEKNVNGNHIFLSGIEFFSDDNIKIISWPKQQISNGIQKNRETATQFKKVVRIFRKLNYEMIDNKVLIAERIAGYLLECLCWNNSNQTFISTNYQTSVRNILIHLYSATKDYEIVKEWGEINELKYLFRTSQPWKLEDVNQWTIAAWNYLGFEH